MLDIEWSQCQFLASMSLVLFVVFVVISKLYHIPTVPLKCRCAIDENDHIKLTIMCTMPPHVTVRVLEYAKVTS